MTNENLTIRLQSVGIVPATRATAETVKVGTVLLWNHHGASVVTAQEFSKSGKTMYLKTELLRYSLELCGWQRTGQRFQRTFKIGRLFATTNTPVYAEDTAPAPASTDAHANFLAALGI